MSNNLLYVLISGVTFIITIFIGFFKNPIYSVLCLLLLILIISLVLLSLNIYYLALTLIIIYAGAVIILFLFLIITMHKDIKLSFDYKLYLPNNLILIFFFIFNLLFMYLINSSTLSFKKPNILHDSVELFIYSLKYESNDIIIFSENLFSGYFIFLLLIVFIMLFALISAIIIAKRSDLKNKTEKIEDDSISKKFIKLQTFYDNDKK